MKKILFIIVTMFSFSLTLLSRGVSAQTNECPSCQYAHEVDWNGVTKIVVLYDENIEQSEVIKEANKRGIEVVYETDNSLYSSRDYRYFSSLYLYYRDGEGITISATPIKDRVNSSSQDAAWSEIYGYIKWHPLYLGVENPSKESSLLHQFQCHVHFAFLKTTWNLETERPDKGFWGFVSSGCN